MKKTSVVSFLITLLLAAAVCTHGKEYVTDTDGNPVVNGVQYFIQPQKSDSGGLAPYANQTHSVCRIIETFTPNELGHPVVFKFIPRPVDYFIPLGLPIAIEFKFKSEVDCDENSPFWYVHDASSAIVLLDRPIHLFAIEKAGEAGANTYKLRSPMGPVGTTPVSPMIGAARQLVVTNVNSKILLVKFRKVHAAATATTSTSRVEKLGLRMFPFY